jgi:flagellar motor switch protein FliN/FliY
MLMDVNLQLSVELGSTQMTVRQILDLQKGAVVELNRIAGDAVDIYVNDRLLAKGEVVVVDDKFGVRITELISTPQEGGLV